MDTYSVPRPTCCRDALYNWAMHVEYPYDITPAETADLPEFCDLHPLA